MSHDQIIRELATLISRQSSLLYLIAGFLILGLLVLGLQLRAISADRKAIAALTAEALYRLPPR